LQVRITGSREAAELIQNLDGVLTKFNQIGQRRVDAELPGGVWVLVVGPWCGLPA
jgi:hypothetical protein